MHIYSELLPVEPPKGTISREFLCVSSIKFAKFFVEYTVISKFQITYCCDIHMYIACVDSINFPPLSLVDLVYVLLPNGCRK
jgi:hypothetical protein